MSNVTQLREPWRKGQSGNPSGMGLPVEARRQLHAARVLMAENAGKGVARLLQLVDDPDARIALPATLALLDRAGLKPVAIDVETTETDSEGNTRTLRVEFVRPDA